MLEHVNAMQDNDMLLLERSYQNTLLYGLLGMLLVYLVVRLVSRKLSECLMLIANSLKLLGAQHQEPPDLPEITALQQRAQGEIKHIVDALSQFQQALVDRHKQDQRIQQLAYFDPLTGLANRRLLLEHLQNALDAITENNHHCALMFIDLDNFKNINDTVGHSAGDEILQHVAERIVRCIGNTDIAAHTGGDEFIILLENLSEKPHEAAARITLVGEKILAALNQPFWLGNNQYNITASIGISLTNHADESIDQIMLNADLALYQAKAAGKNILRFFDPAMQEVVSHRTRLESELRQAIQQQQLLLHYQPQMDRSGQLLGYEALIRWQHPERGMVSPAEFIPLAEETGLIIDIGNWVLHTACKQLYDWRSDPKKSLYAISVNVSSLQFAQKDFPKQVSMAVMDTGANPSRLKLELTESLLLDNVDDTIDKMKAITRMGIHFSLDDFGTGYSSLSYLKHLPISWLKIDQSFVRDMLSDSEDEAIVRTIIVLAKTLSLTVIAEGVETEEQYQHLLRLDCDEFQGYYFGRPAPLE
jgi:diguanylate cyclase (GGDEF)-like protein